MVTDAVAGGARNCKEVAAACGAGRDCGRCLRNLKALVESQVERPRLNSSRAAALAAAPIISAK